jgi:hypothetical protein
MCAPVSVRRARRRREDLRCDGVRLSSQLEGRLLTKNCLLELPQARARLECKLAAQERAAGTVGLERVGLTAGAVEREHQLRAQPLS